MPAPKQTETEKILSDHGYDKAKEDKQGEDRPPLSGKRTPKWQKVEDQLAEMYGFASFGLMPVDPFAAQLIGVQAQSLAGAWVDLAQNSPPVARVIDKILAGGQWGGVIMSHAVLLLHILAHRDALPGPMNDHFRTLNTAMYGVVYESENGNGGNGQG